MENDQLNGTASGVGEAKGAGASIAAAAGTASRKVSLEGTVGTASAGNLTNTDDVAGQMIADSSLRANADVLSTTGEVNPPSAPPSSDLSWLNPDTPLPLRMAHRCH